MSEVAIAAPLWLVAGTLPEVRVLTPTVPPNPSVVESDACKSIVRLSTL